MERPRIHKYLFYLLIVLLPLNLGKHFIFRYSYVKGLLVDYLIPVIYLQDILIFLILAFWIRSVGLGTIRERLKNKAYPRILILFLVSVGLSVLSSQLWVPSLVFFARLVLYVLFAVYVSCEFNPDREFPAIIRLISPPAILLGIIGIAQWIRQGSIFNNYLFFGEQPYTSATRGIAIQNFFGVAKVPAYGIFRHPNIFGGFMSILFIWFFHELINGRRLPYLKSALLFIAVGVIVTGSQAAWAVSVLGIFFSLIIKFKGRKGVVISLALTLLAAAFALLIPVFASNRVLSNAPSIYRRSDLQKSAYSAIKAKPLFGVGAGDFTAVAEYFMPPSKTIRFAQPVHNIFVLVFAESGIFAFSFFVSIFVFAAVLLLDQKYGPAAVLFVSILQIIILGSLDHYFYTIHQTSVLMWFVLGLAFSLSGE